MHPQELADVTWSTPKTAHGLIRATIHVEPADVKSIALRINNTKHNIDLSSLAAVGDSIPVNIHTHLLADGFYEFEVTVDYSSRTVRTPVRKMQVANPGQLASQVRDSLVARNTPIGFAGPCDSGWYDFADQKLIPWFDRSDAEEELNLRIESGAVSVSDGNHLRSFIRDGFMVIRGILSDSLINDAIVAMDTAAASGYQGYKYGDSTRLEQLHVEVVPYGETKV